MLKTIDDLTGLLLHRNPQVRAKAAHALGVMVKKQGLRDERAISELVQMLALTGKDPSPKVRIQAAFALGHIGGDRVLSPLGVALRFDKNAKVRAMAAESLRIVGDKVAAADLRHGTWDKSAIVRAKSARAMGDLKIETSIDALEALLDDKTVAGVAREAIAKIKGDYPG
jgi:HEAT repeat protein